MSFNQNQIPRVITVDKNPAYPPAINELKNDEILPKNVGIKKIGRPFLYTWCFPDRIPNVTFDGVLMFLHTIALKTPKSREKNEGRRYFDYCGITTTEYKWTTDLLSGFKKNESLPYPI